MKKYILFCGNAIETIIKRYTYDKDGRLDSMTYKLNNRAEFLVKHYQYDDLGRVAATTSHSRALDSIKITHWTGTGLKNYSTPIMYCGDFVYKTAKVKKDQRFGTSVPSFEGEWEDQLELEKIDSSCTVDYTPEVCLCRSPRSPSVGLQKQVS